MNTIIFYGPAASGKSYISNIMLESFVSAGLEVTRPIIIDTKKATNKVLGSLTMNNSLLTRKDVYIFEECTVDSIFRIYISLKGQENMNGKTIIFLINQSDGVFEDFKFLLGPNQIHNIKFIKCTYGQGKKEVEND